MTERAVLVEQVFAAAASAAQLGVQDAAPVQAAAPVASGAGPEELAALELAELDAPAPVVPASLAGVQDAASELPGPGGPGASGTAVREGQVAFSSEQPASLDSRVASLAVLLTALSFLDVH